MWAWLDALDKLIIVCSPWAPVFDEDDDDDDEEEADDDGIDDELEIWLVISLELIFALLMPPALLLLSVLNTGGFISFIKEEDANWLTLPKLVCEGESRLEKKKIN